MSRVQGISRTGARLYAGIPCVAIAAVILYGAVLEFYNIAWGTGSWRGEFSLKWWVAFVIFVVLCLAILVAAGATCWRRIPSARAISVRNRIGALRWLVSALVIASPIYLLQYTPWGVVVRGPYLRLLLWGVCVAALGCLIERDSRFLWTREGVLAATLLSGSVFVMGAALTEITDFPFSLGWSEGNRLWDYSLLFGRRRYSFDPDLPPVAYLDTGRQLIGGLPFLLPGVTILGARLWLAAVATLTYLLLGLVAFWPHQATRSRTWILGVLLVFVFLNQGPIHAPLVVSAVLVALASRASVWWGALLVAAAGYFAETSRFTWMFAPAIWAVTLETGAIVPGRDGHSNQRPRRAFTLGLSGLAGSALAYSGVLARSGASVGSSAAVSTSQALLWYRLLPNATYGNGILVGLARAVLPLAVVLLYAAIRYWRPPRLQAAVLVSALVAFLVVGLIVSTKIGGGGDLHNLDMFLIGIVFTAAILWRATGERWNGAVGGLPWWTQISLALAVAIPAYGPLLALRPISFSQDAEWLRVLVDAERTRDLGSLPDNETVTASLDQVRQSVANAKERGAVLFLDQRQLITFGYVRDVQLISEYEKKRLMDEALSGNQTYFDPFYRDLAAKRFALMVSSPLRTPIKDREYGFGEENNAWVEWVARPVLCFYEELDTLNEVKVQLLVPKEGTVDCSSELPRTQ